MTPTRLSREQQRQQIEKYKDGCAQEQFYGDNGQSTTERQEHLAFEIMLCDLALQSLSAPVEAGMPGRGDIDKLAVAMVDWECECDPGAAEGIRYCARCWADYALVDLERFYAHATQQAAQLAELKNKLAGYEKVAIAAKKLIMGGDMQTKFKRGNGMLVELELEDAIINLEALTTLQGVV